MCIGVSKAAKFLSSWAEHFLFGASRTCLGKWAITAKKFARMLYKACQSFFQSIQRSSRARCVVLDTEDPILTKAADMFGS